MPNTLPDNLYYPDEDTEIDELDQILGAMQASVQTALTDVRSDLAPVPIVDTGWTLAGFTPATGWAGLTDSEGRVSSIRGGFRKIGDLVEYRFRVTRTGGTITAGSNGNIGDVLIGNMTNAAFRPGGDVYGTFAKGPGQGTGGARIQPGGDLKILDMYPTATITSGMTIQIDFVFFTG